MDTYSYAYGCGILHPFNRTKREECEERKSHKKEVKLEAKETEAQSDYLLAQAALEAQRKQETWTPLAVTGVVVASLVGIALMVVVIKKARA